MPDLPGTVEAENFDPAGYSDSTVGNQGGAYRADVDVDIKVLGAGFAVGWMTPGEWLEYTVNVPVGGDYDVTLHAGAVDAGRTLELSECGTSLTGPIDIPQIAAWGTVSSTISHAVHLARGLHVLRVTVGSSAFVDFDSMTFELAGSGGTGGGSGGGAAGAGGGGARTCGGGASTGADTIVNLSNVQQNISGFGASTAWASTVSAADADLLWSTSSGAGLSLHRIRIAPDGTTSETNIAKLAVARGVTVWATPWSPPPEDKSNNNAVMGTLTNGQDFANRLASFVQTMKNNGVPIYAVSAQNEPDANVTYESCVYTGATMASFIGDFMGPALASSGAKIMAPETQNWCGFPNFAPALLNDTKAAPYISIIATHEYGCSPSAHPEIAQAGKEFWQTEIYDLDGTEDVGMGSGLRVAQLIHDALTIANMNAWHYWWVYPSSNDNGALWDKGTGQPSKRLWVMGNYSRFVRPGFKRIGTSGASPSGVLLTAFRNPTDGTIAVVAANKNTSATTLSVFISGDAPCSFTPYLTSSSESLAAKSVVSVSQGRFTATLPAQTVTTFVGK